MKKYIVLLAAAALAIACTKEESGLNVSITGFVKLVDTSGVELIDKKDIKVSVHGSSTSTKTDMYGKFLFTGLKAGAVYAFDYYQEGYGTVAYGNYCFVGNQKPGLAGNVTLYQQPKVDLLSSSVSYDGSTIIVQAKTTPTRRLRMCGYVNDSANVSDSHHDYESYFYSISGYDVTSFYYTIPLSNTSYKPSTTIYVAIYFYNSFDGGYYDLDKKKWLYPSSKEAGVLKVTI